MIERMSLFVLNVLPYLIVAICGAVLAPVLIH